MKLACLAALVASLALSGCGGAPAPTASTPAADPIADLAAVRDDACGCTDADCPRRVRAAFDDFLARYVDYPGTREQADEIRGIARGIGACLDRARP